MTFTNINTSDFDLIKSIPFTSSSSFLDVLQAHGRDGDVEAVTVNPYTGIICWRTPVLAGGWPGYAVYYFTSEHCLYSVRTHIAVDADNRSDVRPALERLRATLRERFGEPRGAGQESDDPDTGLCWPSAVTWSEHVIDDPVCARASAQLFMLVPEAVELEPEDDVQETPPTPEPYDILVNDLGLHAGTTQDELTELLGGPPDRDDIPAEEYLALWATARSKIAAPLSPSSQRSATTSFREDRTLQQIELSFGCFGEDAKSLERRFTELVVAQGEALGAPLVAENHDLWRGHYEAYAWRQEGRVTYLRFIRGKAPTEAIVRVCFLTPEELEAFLDSPHKFLGIIDDLDKYGPPMAPQVCADVSPADALRRAERGDPGFEKLDGEISASRVRTRGAAFGHPADVIYHYEADGSLRAMEVDITSQHDDVPSANSRMDDLEARVVEAYGDPSLRVATGEDEHENVLLGWEETDRTVSLALEPEQSANTVTLDANLRIFPKG